MSLSSTNGVRIDDSHEWDQLSRGYNFPSPRNRRPVFVNLLRAEAKRIRERTGWVRALDIGCGTGISEDARVNTAYLGGVREVVDELWGVEPDTSVQPASHFDRVFSATLESLNLGGQTA